MTVPAAAPTRLALAEADAVRDVTRVIHDGPWILGPEVFGSEEAWGRYTELRHAVGVGNGTDALAVAFTALGLSPGAGVLLAADEGGYAAFDLSTAGESFQIGPTDFIDHSLGADPVLLVLCDQRYEERS